jgi:hypothetical protein
MNPLKQLVPAGVHHEDFTSTYRRNCCAWPTTAAWRCRARGTSGFGRAGDWLLLSTEAGVNSGTAGRLVGSASRSSRPTPRRSSATRPSREGGESHVHRLVRRGNFARGRHQPRAPPTASKASVNPSCTRVSTRNDRSGNGTGQSALEFLRREHKDQQAVSSH